MSDAWLTETASNLGRGIAKGEIDPIELTQTYVNAAENHKFSKSIFTHVTKDRAIAEATAAKKRAQMGLRNSLLDGVPISWKDLVDTANIETVAGSELLRGRVPEHDGECLAHATAAGTVCLGKTHMSELAFSGLGYNPVTQTPPCVNDFDAVPGGSSSGAAASVAFDVAAAGIGSDTGGSVRIPAAWNDLVGLKTTAKLVSLKGVVPLAESFDTIGPLCRSVEDAAHLLSALTGNVPAPDLTGASLKGRHFAICKTSMLDKLEDAPAAAFENAINKLAKAGATISEIEIPSVAEALSIAGPLVTVEAYGEWQTTIEANPHLMFDEILERFQTGKAFSGLDFIQAQKRLLQLRQDYVQATARYDGVIAPTSALLPPNLERLKSDKDYYVPVNLLALRNTRIGNLLGLCALTLPTGVPSCGLMVMSEPFSERKLLRIGSAAEAALE